MSDFEREIEELRLEREEKAKQDYINRYVFRFHGYDQTKVFTIDIKTGIAEFVNNRPDRLCKSEQYVFLHKDEWDKLLARVKQLEGGKPGQPVEPVVKNKGGRPKGYSPKQKGVIQDGRA